MTYAVAERFKEIQGEGVYAGTPMAFIRFVGCSVGKRICHYCDTDFDHTLEHLGGGEYTTDELLDWVGDYERVCLTGGEPFDQPGLRDLIHTLVAAGKLPHMETSGTVERPGWFPPMRDAITPVYVCVSPKPGYLPSMIDRADELKVIVPGLGNGKGWPRIVDAVYWATVQPTRPVFLQPRNAKFDVDMNNLRVCEELVKQHPNLRLSVQLHKVLHVR